MIFPSDLLQPLATFGKLGIMMRLEQLLQVEIIEFINDFSLSNQWAVVSGRWEIEPATHGSVAKRRTSRDIMKDIQRLNTACLYLDRILLSYLSGVL